MLVVVAVVHHHMVDRMVLVDLVEGVVVELEIEEELLQLVVEVEVLVPPPAPELCVVVVLESL
jgi:hypothetical protein